MNESTASRRAYAVGFLLVGVALGVAAYVLATSVSTLAGIAVGVVALVLLLAGLGGFRGLGSSA